MASPWIPIDCGAQGVRPHVSQSVGLSGYCIAASSKPSIQLCSDHPALILRPGRSALLRSPLPTPKERAANSAAGSHTSTWTVRSCPLCSSRTFTSVPGAVLATRHGSSCMSSQSDSGAERQLSKKAARPCSHRGGVNKSVVSRGVRSTAPPTCKPRSSWQGGTLQAALVPRVLQFSRPPARGRLMILPLQRVPTPV
jgi:hypothetical protein